MNTCPWFQVKKQYLFYKTPIPKSEKLLIFQNFLFKVEKY